MTERADRRLCLVRHGETVGQSSVRFYGATDVALAPEGRRQVAALAPRLAAYRFAAVACSPLARARDSAALLCGGLAPRPGVEVEPAFREVDFGAIEGLTIDEIRARMPDWAARWHAGEIEGYPGGETLAAFRSRVATGFAALCARHPRGDLLVVCHKGVIKAIVAAALGVRPESLATLPLELGSLTVLAHARGQWLLEEPAPPARPG